MEKHPRVVSLHMAKHEIIDTLPLLTLSMIRSLWLPFALIISPKSFALSSFLMGFPSIVRTGSLSAFFLLTITDKHFLYEKDNRFLFENHSISSWDCSLSSAFPSMVVESSTKSDELRLSEPIDR